jgi:hypothetical protein
MRVSVITPTCDRPVGLALAERFMARQTRQPDEWIIADGGRQAPAVSQGQMVISEPQAPGPQNFARNLLNALALVSGDVVVVWEDDDAYKPAHIETLVRRLESSDGLLIAGDDDQRYYNVAARCWRTFQNIGGCFCQTAFKRSLIPQLRSVIEACARKNSYGIDTAFWKSVDASHWSIARDRTVLGIKGLPGQVGLGLGHRPTGDGWHADPTLSTLRAWIGGDADLYASYGRRVA